MPGPEKEKPKKPVGSDGFSADEGLWSALEHFSDEAAFLDRLEEGGNLDNSLPKPDLIQTLADSGQYEQAEVLLQQKLEEIRADSGAEHPEFADCLTTLAELYLLSEQYEKAEPLITEALEIHRSFSGEEQPGFALSLLSLARLYGAMERDDQAVATAERAVEILRGALGEQHIYFASGLLALANHYFSVDRREEGNYCFWRALDINRKILGDNSPQVIKLLQMFDELQKLNALEDEDQ